MNFDPVGRKSRADRARRREAKRLEGERFLKTVLWTVFKNKPHETPKCAKHISVRNPPSASCRNLDLPPVNLRFLQSHLTKNSFVTAPPHLRGVALNQYENTRKGLSSPSVFLSVKVCGGLFALRADLCAAHLAGFAGQPLTDAGNAGVHLVQPRFHLLKAFLDRVGQVNLV